uniref:Putative outcast ele5 orf2-h 1e-60-j 4 n=1 Tax=Ixodes ricinus TaxID=34613 RepID=A0A0K8RDZ0_IXORI
MGELKVAAKKQSAPGPDKIHYEMLRHLSPESLCHLLTFFNHLWKQAAFPQCWKCAHVIPLLKHGKDPSIPSSYRPIALTSCLGKTYERLINRRLLLFFGG